jgi:signal recognition particle subunit SEC65
MNNVFMLPSQYVLNRWTKYAKRGFYIEKMGKEKENLKAHAARLSRMATSLALKCSVSKPLLDDLERALEKLELEADHSLDKMEETEFPVIPNDRNIQTVNSKISFRVPQVVKGAKSKRSKNAVEKNTRKKRKCSSNNGSYSPHITSFSSFKYILDFSIQSYIKYCC